MLPAETARCVDCYSVLFRDEMNQCPAGHFVCPGCVCDCDVVAQAELSAEAPDFYEAALRSWAAEGRDDFNGSPVALEGYLPYRADLSGTV